MNDRFHTALSEISLVAFLAISEVWPAFAQKTYYVDATRGQDSNSGTAETAPWKTISKVNGTTLAPGDFVLFKCGENWREELIIKSDGMGGNPITFGAYGVGDKPIITAADVVVNWAKTFSRSNVWQTTRTTQTRIVFFDGNLGMESASLREIDREFEWYWQDNILYIYSAADPREVYTHPGIDVGARNNAIVGHDRNYYTIDGLELRGANGKMNSGAGLLLAGDFVTVRNCTFMHNCYAGKHGSDTANYGSIINCEIHHNQGHGIALQSELSWSIHDYQIHSDGSEPMGRNEPDARRASRVKPIEKHAVTSEIRAVHGLMSSSADTVSPRAPTNVREVVAETPDRNPSPADGFVTRRGNKLVSGGNDQPLHLRGVNFAGYFMISEDGDWYTEGVERRFPSPDADVPVALHEVWKDWFKEQHFAFVAQTGFNVIRVPLTYRIFENNSAPGRFKPEGWSFVDKYVGWAKRHHVYLILDMHVAPGGLQTSSGGKNLWTEPGLQQRYRNLWKTIAGRYANETIIAGYDLLNEPHPASSATNGNGDNKQWETLAQQVVDDIRSVDRNHLIIVEAVNWVDDGTISDWSPEVLENFQFLVDDENVMYDFHFYFPFDYIFTAKPDRYPSTKKVPTMQGHRAVFDREYLEAELKSVCRFSSTYNVPMNFGEWCGPAIDKTGGLEYVGDLVSLFDQLEIHWTFWSILDFYTHDAELKDQHLIPDRLNIFKSYFSSSRSSPNRGAALIKGK